MTDDQFMANGQPVGLTMTGYREWFARNQRIGTFKTSVMEYCVGKQLAGLETPYGSLYRIGCRDDQLSDDGVRVELRWSEWTGTTDAAKRNSVSFPLMVVSWPDIILFGLHDTSDRYHPVLDLDAWDFYSVSCSRMRDAYGCADRISLQDILKLRPVWSDYNGIPEALAKAQDA